MSMIIHKKYLPDIDIDTSSFIYERNYILIQDEYICDVLKCMNVPEINEYQFYIICSKYFKDYPEVLECYALKSPNNAEYSYLYARYVLKGRFELGENIIATDVMYSYLYARHALNGRFELGEPIITTDAEYSYYYARYVFKDRFELGEHAIFNSRYEFRYRERFL